MADSVNIPVKPQVDSKQPREEIKKITEDLRNASKEAANIGRQFQQSFGGAKGLARFKQDMRQLSQLAAAIRSGTPDSQITRAEQRGREQIIESYREEVRLHKLRNTNLRALAHEIRTTTGERKIELEILRNQVLVELQKEKIAQLAKSSNLQNIAIKERELEKLARLEQAGRELLAQQRQLTAEKAKTAREAERAAKAEARHAEQAKRAAQRVTAPAATVRPQLSLAERAQQTRNFADELRFGDGGAFLMRTQAGLLFNFSLIAGMVRSVGFLRDFVIDLDREFNQLQAITGTTNTEMKGLEKTLKDVAESTKFTAVEVAEAATIMGQAGFSTREIEDSIEAVTKLATATGTDLKTSVDVITSTMVVFQMQASEATNVANVMTAAINESKLTMDKMALGVQYASNIAYQAGMEFSELAAVMGGLADAGVRSGSTIGTGIRQLIIDIETPTKKFRNALDRVGLTLEDVNVKSHGFIGVLRNLKDAGFTSADAMESFEVRAAASATAMLNQIDNIERLEQSLLLTSASTKAAEVQMKSFSNIMDRFGSVAGVLADEAFEPTLDFFKAFFEGLVQAGEAARDFSGVLKVVGTALTVFLGVAVTKRLATMSRGFFALGKAAEGASKGVKELSLGARLGMGHLERTTKQVTLLTRAIRSLWSVTGVGLALTGASLLFDFLSTRNASTSLEAEADRVQAAVDKMQGSMEARRQTLTSIDEEMARLISRSAHLTGNTRALETEQIKMEMRFKGIADIIDQTGSSLEGLIEALRRYRVEQQKFLGEDLGKIQSSLEMNIEVLRSQMQRATGAEALGNVLRGSGYDRYSLTRLGRSDALIGEALGIISTPDAAAVTRPTHLAGLIAQLEARRGKVRDDITAGVGSERLNKRMDTLLTNIIDQLQTINNTNIELANNQAKLQQTEIQIAQNRYAAEAEVSTRGVEDLARQFRQVIANVTGDINLSDTARTSKYEQTIRPLMAEVDTQIAQIEEMEQLEPEKFEAYLGVLTSLRELRSAILREWDRLADISDPLHNAQLAQSIAAGQKQIEKEISRYKASSNIGGFQTAYDNIQKLGAQILEDQLAKFDLENKKQLDDHVVQNNRAELQRKIKEQVSKFLQDLTYQIDRVVQAAFEISAEEIDKIDRERFRSTLALSRNDLRRQAADLPQHSAGVSDVTRNTLDLRRFDLERDLLAKEIEHLAATKRAHERTLTEVSAGRAASELRVAQGDTNALQAVDQFRRKELDLKREIDAINRQIVTSTQQLNVLYGEQASESGPLGQLNQVMENYLQTSMKFTDMNAQLGNAIQAGFDKGTEGFTNFVRTVLRGSGSVVDAVKNMAVGIIEAMLEIVETWLAHSVLSLIFSSFMPGFTGGQSGAVNTGALQMPSAPSTGTAPLMFSQGGVVRGGVENRDSVHAMLMPGEYVLRKSAVDAIGVETLEKLNAQGNRTVSSGSGKMSAAASANDNRQKTPVVTNLWVVPQDQVPPPGPRDIVAIITDDIARGGRTKQLIKQVVNGF